MLRIPLAFFGLFSGMLLSIRWECSPGVFGVPVAGCLLLFLLARRAFSLCRKTTPEGILPVWYAAGIVLLLAVAAGGLLGGWRMQRVEECRAAVRSAEEVLLTATEDSCPAGSRHAGLFSGTAGGVRFRARLLSEEAFSAGDTAQVASGLLEIPGPSRGTGQPDWHRIWLGRNVLFTGTLPSGALCPGSPGRAGPAGWLEARRSLFFRQLENWLGGNAAYVQGMVFGDTRRLGTRELEHITRLGVRHLFAVSGMHVGIFFVLCLLVSCGLGLRGRARSLGIGVLLLGFLLLTGMTPSAMRAGLVLFLCLLSENMGWQKSLVRSLSLVGIGMLLAEPLYVLHTGFQLSFAAAFGIACLSPVLDALFPGRIFWVGCAAWLFTLPLQQAFGVTTPLGILLTPLFSLLLAGIIPVTLLLFLVFALPGGGIAAAGLEALVAGLDLLLRGLSWEPVRTVSQGMQFALPQVSPVRILMYYGFLGILCRVAREDRQPRIQRTRKRVLVPAVLVLCVLFLVTPVLPSGLHVTFLDVGQGDSVVIRQGDRTVLVDGGTRAAGERSVVPFLRSQGVRRLDLMVLTHPHEDHMGGLLPVLKEFPVDTLLLSEASRAWMEQDHRSFLSAVEEKGIRTRWLVAGDSAQAGSLRFEVLSPTWDLLQRHRLDENGGSLVLLLHQEGIQVQLTGDLEGPGLFLLARGTPREGIYLHKAPHHGSINGFDPAVMDGIPADLVVISCGVNNRHGHPHPAVVEYWTDRSVPLFRTDRAGEIRFRYRNGQLTAQTALAMW